MNNNLINACGPLFLIGMPRSGTKLLRGLLNQHPQIAIPAFETEFMPGLLKKYSAQYKFERKEFSNLYHEMLKFPYFRYQSEHGRLVTEDDLFAACNDYRLPGIFEALIRCSTDTVGDNNILWGDKSPSYICHIKLLKKVYPSAKFIHIVRDVRDYALSISNAWGKNKLRAAQRWANSLDEIREDVKQMQDDVFVVKYEDLLDNHENILHDILKFLGLPFDERVLELSVASENLGAAKGKKVIVSTNKNKYKAAFTTREILDIERLAAQTLLDYGYPVDYTGPRKYLNFIERRYYQVLDAINLIAFEKSNRGTWGSIVFYWNYFRATRGI